MKKQLKGFTMGLIVATLLVSTVFGDSILETIKVRFNGVNLTVNGKKVDTPNILYKGTTYIPLRATSELLGKEVTWDQKTNTAGINDKGNNTVVEKPSEKKYTRDNPAPIGASQTTSLKTIFNEYTSKITVVEVLKGEELHKKIIEKNGDYPVKNIGKDLEWIGVKVRHEILDAKEDKEIHLYSGYYNIYTGNNVKNNNFTIYTINPNMDAKVFVNGSYEGYLLYKVDKNDPNPKLAYGQSASDGSGGIWFSLGK